jgi:flagellar biogenesis protein FliO
MAQQSDKERGGQASSSVRVAILVFLGSFVLLFVMGLIWLFIRVEAPASARLHDESASTLVASRNDLGLGQRSIFVFDNDRRTFFG